MTKDLLDVLEEIMRLQARFRADLNKPEAAHARWAIIAAAREGGATFQELAWATGFSRERIRQKLKQMDKPVLMSDREYARVRDNPLEAGEAGQE